MRHDILDFYDITPAAGFDVPFQQAITYFQAKGLKPSFGYADAKAEEHAVAFTIAKMMDVDMLSDVKNSLDQAIAAGTPFRDWADQIIPTLQAKGWWGRKAVIDPVTGQEVVSQLGSPGRLQTIFRTNMQSSYAVGSWLQIEDQKQDAKYLMYDAVDDYRTRPEHHAWDNKVLPVNSSWWRTHYPPNGWNCRCSVIQLDDSDVERLGLSVDKPPKDGTYEWLNPRTGKYEEIPNGIDPGFQSNPGLDRLDQLKDLLMQKISALPDELQQAAQTVAEQIPPPEPPTYKTFTPLKTVKEAEKWISNNVAGTVSLPKTAKISGMNEIALAVLEVNQRFDLPPVRFIGDHKSDVHSYRMGRRAMAAYAPRTDAFLLTARATDDIAMKTKHSGEGGGYSQKVIMDILSMARYRGREGAAKVLQLVESSLKNGTDWSIVRDSRSLAMHELGHRLHQFNQYQLDEIASQAMMDGWHLLISRYGSTNRSEFIAEAFALYMTGGESEYWRINPKLLDWFKSKDKEMQA